MRDSRRTDRDKNSAQNQGQYDADHECLLLIYARHLEAGHNQDEDKQVIDGQAVFGDPAGQELHAVRTTVMQPHIQAERERKCDIERQRQRGFPDGGDRKSTRLNSSHVAISYAVFCLIKKKYAGQTSVLSEKFTT